jgi:hypothetical protein
MRFSGNLPNCRTIPAIPITESRRARPRLPCNILYLRAFYSMPRFGTVVDRRLAIRHLGTRALCTPWYPKGRANRMNLLIYTPEKAEGTLRLLTAVKEVFPEEQWELCHSLEQLGCKLRQPGKNPRIVMLNPVDRDQLDGMLVLGDLLTDSQVILVLPDRDRVTISRGHRLSPRFITYANTGLDDACAVLRKMTRAAQRVREST